MFNISTLLLTGIVGLIIGVAVGIFYSRRFTAVSIQHKETEQHLSELQQQQTEYQHEVTEHFSDTAKLLSSLAESYRDVHNHLANGADKLTKGDLPADTIPRLPESNFNATEGDESPDSISQPLDYAPKNSPHEPGMLNEEFGLEKEQTDDHVDLEAPLQK